LCAALSPSAAGADEPGGTALEDKRSDFHRVRMVTFVSILLGYAAYYITRLSFTFVAPVMRVEAGLDLTKMGVVLTIFPLAYACSKFLGGILGDLVSPKQMLALGLVVTGVINVAFGAGSSVTWFACMWAINGMFQGLGAPACAKILTNWYSPKDRGTWWGVWNVGHNLGGFAIPFIAGGCARSFGWRAGMAVPGVIGIVAGLLVLVVVTDSPKRKGLPTPEEIAEDHVDTKPKQVQAPQIEASDSSSQSVPAPVSKRQGALLALRNVMGRWEMWLLGFSYFGVYAIRQGILNWMQLYLIDVKMVQNTATAAAILSSFELGGLFGNLVAGASADFLIRRRPMEGAAGKRIQVMILAFLGTIGCLFLFAAVPGSAVNLQWALLFLLGVAVYTPQMLMAVVGAEIVSKQFVATSNGFLGFIAYLGAACSGLPMTWIVRNFGWQYWFTSLTLANIAAATLILPLWRLPTYGQRYGDAKGAVPAPAP